MFEKQILEPYERFKIIREKIGASQEELAGEEIDRSQISRIESNKTKLTKNKALYLSKNINNFIEKNKIDFPKVTEDLILKDINNQINEAVELFYEDFYRIKIEKSLNNFQDIMNEFNEFKNKYSKYISEESIYKIYEGIVEALFDLGRINESENYYYLANKAAREKKDYLSIVRLVLLRSNIYEKRTNYDNALSTLQEGFKLLPLVPYEKLSDLRLKLNYNTALSYKKKKKYAEAIKKLEAVKNEINVPYMTLVYAISLEANCYTELGNYEKSEELYLYLIDKIISVNDISFISRAYRNLSELACKKGDFEKAEKYLNTVLEMMKFSDVINVAITEQFATLIYILIDKSDEVVKYYKDALIKINKIEDYFRAYELIDYVVDYFIKKNQINNLEEIISVIEENIINKNYKNKLLGTKLYKVAYYFSKFDLNKAEKYYKKAEKIESILKESD